MYIGVDDDTIFLLAEHADINAQCADAQNFTAVSCSVLRCVARCSALQCVAECSSVFESMGNALFSTTILR